MMRWVLLALILSTAATVRAAAPPPVPPSAVVLIGWDSIGNRAVALAETRRLLPHLTITEDENATATHAALVTDDIPEQWGLPHGVAGITVIDPAGKPEPMSLILSCYQAGAVTCGRILAHEIAHQYGFDHSDDKDDLMYPTHNGQSKCAACAKAGL